MEANDFLNEVLKDLPACNKFTDKSKPNAQYLFSKIHSTENEI